MTTALDLITLALKDAGVTGIGQTPSAEDTNDAFTRLNMMLGQWQRKRWLIWHLTDNAFTSTGAQSYTVGPGGNFNIATRPDRLEAAFFRNLNSSTPNLVDYPFSVIPARENYNDIALKTLGSWPQFIFYDSAFPVGTIYPWPVPASGQFEIHLTLKEQLAQFTSLTETINLPLEYFAAIHYNLIVRLGAAYQLPANPVNVALAAEALTVIRGANSQIPVLRMPTDLVQGGSGYNVFSDQTY